MFARLRLITPLVIEGCRCGAIMAAGDVLAQIVVEKKVENFDILRTVKYGSLGLVIVGPTLRYWYNFLNHVVSPKQSRFKITLKKMLLDQSIAAPTLTMCVTIILAKLNRESNDIIKERIRDQYPIIMRNNYLLWPAIQMINFGIVPLKYQVTFVQVVAVAWNVFLSDILNSPLEKK